MSIEASILISSYNRSHLLKRTLWGIANRPPAMSYEVILADDGSSEDIVGVLQCFSSCFRWKLVQCDHRLFTEQTRIEKFHNNPAWTNNVAFKHSRGRLVYLMGNEIIPVGNVFNDLLEHAPRDREHWLTFSTTYDMGQHLLDQLDEYGSNLNDRMIKECKRFPLQDRSYRSDVTNYLSLSPRSLWERIGGYDERYVGGISADDSDFVRRARELGAQTVIVDGITLHQYHQGKTTYYDPPVDCITPKKWEEGVRRNHAVYKAWDKTFYNQQGWAWGSLGVTGVISNE